MEGSYHFGLIIMIILTFFLCICMLSYLLCIKPSARNKSGCSDGRVTNTTPVSLLEVKVTLPMEVIFGDGTVADKYDLPELPQIPKTRLGEGTMGSLFKVVLNCGSIITIRKIRSELISGADDLKLWINFFGGISNARLLPILFSFWYGGEAYILYDYMCLGSLEELLHGSEGIQFTPLNWGIRMQIALDAAKAVACIHNQLTKNGEALICGVIKSSNILIGTDFSAHLSSYETPYLVPTSLIIRRNPGRMAPQLRHGRNYSKSFTQESDVYSFGVLLLELITGKRPSMTNLGEYILETTKKDGLKGMYDKKIGEVKENMIGMARVAQLCVSRDPEDRPSMDKVVTLIQGLPE